MTRAVSHQLSTGRAASTACSDFTPGLACHNQGGRLTRSSRDFQHVVADFVGVPANQLADRALISGLVVAAASAAGMNAASLPTLRDRKAGGLIAALLHDDCHITVHAVPERELLLVDVLAPRTMDVSRAIDVFARRLTARQVHRDTRDRA
jgi:S-adenosylmethionine/arginine decarboxylase-like enzyme